MASILVVTGPNQGDYFPLGHRVIVVGRDEGCPIQIVDERVSRKHVQIRFDHTDDRYHALDMKSGNGTFVNDQRLAEAVTLADGDVIAIGGSELMFLAVYFPDRETAFEHYRKRGERTKSTVIR